MAKIRVNTGATQGIGRRTTEMFAGAGYALGLADLREQGGDKEGSGKL